MRGTAIADKLKAYLFRIDIPTENVAEPFSFGFARAWNECVPGFAPLARDMSVTKALGRVRNIDQMITGRTLDLPTGKLRVALEMLFAMRALKFKFVFGHETI